MKKILSLLTISLLVLFASCDLNQMPEFDDSEAFVGFVRPSLSISEKGGTLRVPVTLASVKGISETVSFTVIDSTAKEGVNFSIVGDKSLTFNADNRTQHIEVAIIDNPGVFTGDLRFTIELAADGKIKPSADNSCLITIQDEDHPLSSILGTYSTVAESAFGGDVPFDFVITKDESDVTVVWIANICGIGTGPGIYGVVNEDKTEIALPIEQIHQTDDAGSNGDGNIYLYGITPDAKVATSGNIIVKIEDGGATLNFDTLGAGLCAGGLNVGFYEALLPGYTGTKL